MIALFREIHRVQYKIPVNGLSGISETHQGFQI